MLTPCQAKRLGTPCESYVKVTTVALGQFYDGENGGYRREKEGPLKAASDHGRRAAAESYREASVHERVDLIKHVV